MRSSLHPTRGTFQSCTHQYQPSSITMKQVNSMLAGKTSQGSPPLPPLLHLAEELHCLLILCLQYIVHQNLFLCQPNIHVSNGKLLFKWKVLSSGLVGRMIYHVHWMMKLILNAPDPDAEWSSISTGRGCWLESSTAHSHASQTEIGPSMHQSETQCGKEKRKQAAEPRFKPDSFTGTLLRRINTSH